MKRDQYWKNFKLGKELDISGRFIYNGLQTFHEMQHFAYEEEIFEFLYNISVGIERLLKIAVILIEHNEAVDQADFEESLITHNHGELLRRVKKAHKLNFSNTHNEFLGLLSKFYKTSRYGRYNLDAMTIDDWEKTEFINFLNKGLSISIDIKSDFSVTQNDMRIKKYIGKIIGKIAADLYKIIGQEARRLNIYTYEVRYGSKACKIFTAKEYNFEKEDILRRELLVYFVNSNDDGGQSRFMRSITPLSFDPALEADYISCFDSNVKTINVMDELEALYEDEIKDVKDRKGALEAIGSAYLYYDPNEDDEEEDED
jgi:hypothetical protein